MPTKNYEIPYFKGKMKWFKMVFVFLGILALLVCILWILDGFVWRDPSGYVTTLIIALVLTIITLLSKNQVDTDKSILLVRNMAYPFGKKLLIDNIVTITETKNKTLLGWVDGFVVKTSDGDIVKGNIADLKGFVVELKSINPKIGIIKG